MRTLEELQSQLVEIYNELEERKLAEKNKSYSEGLDAISSRAQRCAIKNHALKNCDEHTQEMYLLLLFSVASLDDNAYSTSLFTIFRIIHGMEYKGDAQALLLRAKQMNFEMLDECTRLFINSDKKHLLVTECLLIAANFIDGKQKAMEFIADICSLLCFKEDELMFTSNMARAILTLDPSEYRCDIRNDTDAFDAYVDLIFEKHDKKICVLTVTAPKFKKSNYGESIYIAAKAESRFVKSESYVVVRISYAYSDCDLKDVGDLYDNERFSYLRKLGHVIELNCPIEKDCLLFNYHADLWLNSEVFQKISGMWSRQMNDYICQLNSYRRNDNITSCIGFAANSLLLYHEAEKKFIEEGGQSLDKISKVYGREILK